MVTANEATGLFYIVYASKARKNNKNLEQIFTTDWASRVSAVQSCTDKYTYMIGTTS